MHSPAFGAGLDPFASGGRVAVKRPADEALVTEEHKRCRLALDGVADERLCPITQELPLDPVMAEDLRFYERASIEEWFRRNEAAVRSPVTNVPMARVLEYLPQVRSTIEKLVDSGAITGGKADLWKKRRAQEKKVSRMRRRAAGGEVEAMRRLGLWYDRGENGVQTDHAQAFAWYKRAADLGDVMATALVGQMYCQGVGVTSNFGLGTARLGLAAAMGSNLACYELFATTRMAGLAVTWMLRRRLLVCQDSRLQGQAPVC
jgi:hypothetical protein